jgi:mannan endo-1,4-beta-mannosidase
MHGRPMAALGIAVTTVLLLVAQVLSPDSIVVSSTRTVALGVGIPDGRDLSALDVFRQSIGGPKVAAWTIWRGWNPQSTGVFPTAAVEGARQRGAVPIIWWVPHWCCDPKDPKWSRNQNIVDGLYDDYIRAFARDAKQYGDRIVLRFAHQANADYVPWGWDYSATDDNTVDTFKAMWRHVHGIFRDVGATNVKFLWTVATQTCAGDGTNLSFTVTNCMGRALGYPGDAYVDYIGFTWENWAKAPSGSDVGSGPWVSMLDGFKPVVDKLKNVSDKPIIAAAIASAPDGGDRAQWIRKGYRQVYDKLPRVVAIVWLNADLSGPPHLDRDWSLRGSALDAYAEIAALPQFQGRIH